MLKTKLILSCLLLTSILVSCSSIENHKNDNENTTQITVSQFNHIDNTYIKKSLGNRWNTVGGNKVQSDVYSSFLIKNTANNLNEIDIELCNKNFDKFLKIHNQVIDNIKNEKHLRNKKILKCFGI